MNLFEDYHEVRVGVIVSVVGVLVGMVMTSVYDVENVVRSFLFPFSAFLPLKKTSWTEISILILKALVSGVTVHCLVSPEFYSSS